MLILPKKFQEMDLLWVLPLSW